tara:strand:- start:90 stop:500 length:411 start_codon:yes stop_codon:yes gene_type:complete
MARVRFSQFGVSRGSLEWVQIRENPGEGRFHAGASYIKNKLCSIGVRQKPYAKLVESNLLKYIDLIGEGWQAEQLLLIETRPVAYRTSETYPTPCSPLASFLICVSPATTEASSHNTLRGAVARPVRAHKSQDKRM